MLNAPVGIMLSWCWTRKLLSIYRLRNKNMYTQKSTYFSCTYWFSKILLYGSHLSDNRIYCSIINAGDVNSYWAAFQWLYVKLTCKKNPVQFDGILYLQIMFCFRTKQNFDYFRRTVIFRALWKWSEIHFAVFSIDANGHYEWAKLIEHSDHGFYSNRKSFCKKPEYYEP